MPVRCREEAETVFGDDLDALASIVLESVRFYYEFYGERAHLHESWTRCSIIRDEIKERLTAYSEATKGFQVIRDGNATYFGVRSKFAVRIKKLFDDLHANTGKTQLSMQFDRQEPMQAEMFSDEELTHLYLGYVAVENDPLNPPMYLVCNDGAGGIAWDIPLHNRPSGSSSKVEPFVPPALPPEGPSRIRVRADNKKKVGE